jgi:hypothetical protein
MTLPRKLLIKIATTVADHGGDIDDADDLVATWQRLDSDTRGRVDRMRHEARTAACCCAWPADPAEDGRCSRCYGAMGAGS